MNVVVRKNSKKRETEYSKESMSNIDVSISFYTTKGSQNNRQKCTVHNTIKNDKISKSDLSRKIQSTRGSKHWDGGTYDKEFQDIKKCINRAERSSCNTKNFNLDLFKSLSSKETNKILKIKQTFCIDKSAKVKRRIGKNQNEMENDVMKHIDELWDTKRRVSRMLVFRHMEVLCARTTPGLRIN